MARKHFSSISHNDLSLIISQSDSDLFFCIYSKLVLQIFFLPCSGLGSLLSTRSTQSFFKYFAHDPRSHDPRNIRKHECDIYCIYYSFHFRIQMQIFHIWKISWILICTYFLIFILTHMRVDSARCKFILIIIMMVHWEKRAYRFFL